MSAEHGEDRITKIGRFMRHGGIWVITAAAAGLITGTTLAQLVLAGGIGSILGTALENRKKYFGTPHAASQKTADASHH